MEGGFQWTLTSSVARQSDRFLQHDDWTLLDLLQECSTEEYRTARINDGSREGFRDIVQSVKEKQIHPSISCVV